MIIDLIGFLVFGLFVGAVARLIKPGRQGLSLVATLLLGVVGSLIGGFIAKHILGSGDYFELNFWGAIIAIVAAFLLVGTAEGLSSKKR